MGKKERKRESQPQGKEERGTTSTRRLAFRSRLRPFASPPRPPLSKQSRALPAAGAAGGRRRTLARAEERRGRKRRRAAAHPGWRENTRHRDRDGNGGGAPLDAALSFRRPQAYLLLLEELAHGGGGAGEGEGRGTAEWGMWERVKGRGEATLVEVVAVSGTWPGVKSGIDNFCTAAPLCVCKGNTGWVCSGGLGTGAVRAVGAAEALHRPGGGERERAV